jgi:signal transduction histidine kinase
MSSIRSRIVLVVFAVTACLFSLLGTIGFVQLAHSGRSAMSERINFVLDQLETGLRAGATAVSIRTADGVTAEIAETTTRSKAAFPDVIQVRRDMAVGSKRLTLIGSASKAPLTQSLASLYRMMWFGIPLAVLLATAAASVAVQRALLPVAEITRFARSVSRERSAARVPVPDTDDEIQELATTVNAMLTRLEESQRQQKQFTSDAAHELRTPLMALQGEIELASRLDQPADQDFLDRVESLTRRLASRVDDLVLLSLLDEQSPLRLEQVALDDVLRFEATLIRAQVIDGSDRNYLTKCDRNLIARAVRNLLVNARRHASATVIASIVHEGCSIAIHVDDDGSGIPQDAAKKIFQRFGRLDEARSGGSGLGLAIVKSIAAAHGGDVQFEASPLGGARFTLRLPSHPEDIDSAGTPQSGTKLGA